MVSLKNGQTAAVLSVPILSKMNNIFCWNVVTMIHLDLNILVL